jgi:hypothetical protein
MWISVERLLLGPKIVELHLPTRGIQMAEILIIREELVSMQQNECQYSYNFQSTYVPGTLEP